MYNKGCMRGQRTFRSVLSVILFIIIMVCILPAGAGAVDEENCLFCHKYRGLSYINKEEDFRLLYVTEDFYLNSPHGSLKCSDCHEEIGEFPHVETPKVDCLKVCHMDDPSSGLPFSHQKVGEYLDQSVHGRFDEEGKPKEYQEDYPDCKTCHMDPLYRPLSFLKDTMPGLEEKTIARCAICHEGTAFMAKFFNHFTSRMQKLRKPMEVVEMCGSCHGNADMMERHDLPNLLKSYMETFHGKALVFGDEKSADCTDCHVSSGESIHSIHSMHDPKSAAYKDNIYKTCSNIDCHPDAEMNLAGYKAHVMLTMKRNPVEFIVCSFFVILTIGSFVPLMIFTVLDMLRNVFPNYVLFRKRSKK